MKNYTRYAPAVAVAVLATWALCTWLFLRPSEIATGWHAWRQTDTETIAVNFTQPGSSILAPKINWGGDGPGYVETEFQIYTRTISLLMGVLGDHEWIGQLCSLAAITAAAWVVFVHLSETLSPVGAFCGLFAFLAVRTSCHLATVIMPDAFALLAYLLAWRHLLLFARKGAAGDVILYGLFGTLAMLTKPTTAHLGISSFVLIVLAHRGRLREYRLWITWAVMLGVFAAYLAQAHQLYTEFGNTFGLIFGEDSKAPSLTKLFALRPYIDAARFGIPWGFGYVALVCLAVQTFRRRLHAEHLALAVGNVAVVFVALRYMAEGAGVHYFAPASLLAAFSVASLADDVQAMGRRWALTGLILLATSGELYRSMSIRYYNANTHADTTAENIVIAGKELDRLTDPDELVVVRSPNPAFETVWQQAINYHDPRVFYLSRTRGWTLGREQADFLLLTTAIERGARYFVDPLPDHLPALDTWLASHGEVVWSREPGARIWNLHREDKLSR